MTARETKLPVMPKLFVIPAGAKTKRCDCGRTLYMVREGGVHVPVTTPPSLTTTRGEIDLHALGVQPPGDGQPGLGINHFIDCPKRATYKRTQRRAAGGVDLDERIARAEAVAQQYGVRCTGAPHATDCNGFAVVAFNLRGRLFATPCSVHADKVQRELRLNAAREFTVHALDEFLIDRGERVARAFAEKAAHVKRWNADVGFRVPTRGQGIG